jgi:hypothetical protein
MLLILKDSTEISVSQRQLERLDGFYSYSEFNSYPLEVSADEYKYSSSKNRTPPSQNTTF